jgi:predicted permease
MHDLRVAARELRVSPIVTAVAVVSLALGIGANTAIFSLVNSLLLRSLPVVEPQRLAIVSDTRAVGQGSSASWSYGIWDQIRRRGDPFDGMGAWWTERLNLAQHGGETEPVDGMWVSGDYFSTLGVPPLLGRTIGSDDDVKGGGPDGAVAVLSYDMWQRRFGGAANVVGLPIVIERVPFTIVGVAPPGFFGAEVGRTFDVALPMNDEPLIRGAESRINPERGFYALTVLLRLKPGQSVDTATAILRGIQPQIREAAMPATLPTPFRKEFLKDAFTAVSAATGISRLRARYERPLVVILVVVALVLLIACANIANLQLARAIARRHDLSVRVALGASRWRLARQSLAESLLLSAAGALLGLLFATWSSRLLVEQLSTALSRVYLDLSIDGRVLAFTGGIAIATTVLFGVLPAWRASGVAPIEALKEQGRGSWTGARARLSTAPIVGQVALSVVIVVAAGLFVRSFEKLATLPLGFDSDRVLLVSVNFARTHVAPSERVAFLRRLVEEVAAVPGVANAGGSMNTPVTGLGIIDIVHVPGVPLSGQPMTNGKLSAQSTFANFITPGWFQTYGTPIKAGRDFTDQDVKGAPGVIIVNEAFVRKFLGGEPPVGATVAFERGRDALVSKTIVGVVADAAYSSLRSGDVPTEYTPLAQLDFVTTPPAEMTVSARASGGPPMLMARGIASALTAVDRDLVFGFRPMTDQVSASLTQERIVAILSGFFGVLALLLAALGLYGITAYSVAGRRTEIGIRMALGATGPVILRLVVARIAALVGAGILIGAGLSVWASTFVATLLYGLDPRDPLTLVGAGAVLMAVATAAAWLPAYRASRLDPATVLRET